jgi:hypothetical protein
MVTPVKSSAERLGANPSATVSSLRLLAPILAMIPDMSRPPDLKSARLTRFCVFFVLMFTDWKSVEVISKPDTRNYCSN